MAIKQHKMGLLIDLMIYLIPRLRLFLIVEVIQLKRNNNKIKFHKHPNREVNIDLYQKTHRDVEYLLYGSCGIFKNSSEQ